MSIVELMQEAAATKGRPSRRARLPRVRGTGSGPHEPASQEAAVVRELTRFIPTEAIALYVAVLPFLVADDTPLANQKYTSRWILAAGVGVIAVLFAVGIYRRELQARGKSFHWPPRRTVFVVAAFTAWVFVIPGSPFASFSWYTPAIGAIGGLVANTGLALFGLWFGEPETAG